MGVGSSGEGMNSGSNSSSTEQNNSEANPTTTNTDNKETEAADAEKEETKTEDIEKENAENKLTGAQQTVEGVQSKIINIISYCLLTFQSVAEGQQKSFEQQSGEKVAIKSKFYNYCDQ